MIKMKAGTVILIIIIIIGAWFIWNEIQPSTPEDMGIDVSVDKPFVTVTYNIPGNYNSFYFNGESSETAVLLIAGTLDSTEDFPWSSTTDFTEFQDISYHRMKFVNTDTGQESELEWTW
jgi:hypothetical protein